MFPIDFERIFPVRSQPEAGCAREKIRDGGRGETWRFYQTETSNGVGDGRYSKSTLITLITAQAPSLRACECFRAFPYFFCGRGVRAPKNQAVFKISAIHSITIHRGIVGKDSVQPLRGWEVYLSFFSVCFTHGYEHSTATRLGYRLLPKKELSLYYRTDIQPRGFVLLRAFPLFSQIYRKTYLGWGLVRTERETASNAF